MPLSFRKVFQPGTSEASTGTKKTSPDISEMCSCNSMVLGFPKVSPPGISEAYSGTAMALSMSLLKVSQSDSLKAHSGSIMPLNLPKVSSSGIAETCSCNIMAFSVPGVSHPDILEA